MTTIQRIRTDEQHRFHLEMDSDAVVLNSFVVKLPPYTLDEGILIYREGAPRQRLMAEALDALALVRAEVLNPVAPLEHFQPYGIITERDVQDVWRETELRILRITSNHPSHMERVRSVSRMADLLGMCGPIPVQQTVPLPDVTRD